MATSWNNLGLHGVDQSHHDESDRFYTESLSPSSQGFAQWPSPQPTNSTTPLNLQEHRILTPPPPSRQNTNPRTLSDIITSAGPLSPRGPLSPSSTQSPRSPHSSGFQSLHRSQFPSTPVTPSIISDPFATPRTTITSTVKSGRISPRVRRSHGNLDTMLEHPYQDSPPGTAGLKGNGYFPGAMDVTEPAEVAVREGWRPEWLGRRIIGAFVGAFIVLAVLCEVVNWLISQKTWESSVQGLWTFGPIVGESSICVEALMICIMAKGVLNKRHTDH